MARTPKEMLEEILSWPECGGFQHERLAEILSEFEARIEKLEGGEVVFCADCLMYGTPAPGFYDCGNCGSKRIRIYREVVDRTTLGL